MHRNLLVIGAIIILSAMVLMVPATTISVDAVCAGGGSVKACAGGGSAFAKAFGALAFAYDGIAKAFVKK
jgi:hypothetical protein